MMAEPRTYKLPLPPSANNYWAFGALRSRSYRGGKIPLTKAAKDFRDEVAVSVFYQNGRKPIPPFVGPCLIECEIVWPDRRRRDSGNMPKQLEDALQMAGVVLDDVQFVEHHYWVDLTRIDSEGCVNVKVIPLDEDGTTSLTKPRKATVKQRLTVGRKAVSSGR